MSATPQLPIEQFGSELLRTLDLDPVYVMLVHADLSSERLAKWLLAYWCFYHCGVASLLSEEQSNIRYWVAMGDAAVNDRTIKTWPRGAERRHFRGAQAVRGVRGLHELFLNPPDMIEQLKERRTFKALNKYVQTWPQFGPWIAFKVCDMAQCVLGHELDFTGAALDMYAEPVKGAAMAYHRWNPNEGDVTHDNKFYVDYAVERLTRQFREFKAPPHFNRPVGLMEVETVLCKWKSHMNGHYPVGHDTVEIAHGLDGWGDTAQHLKNILLSHTLVPGIAERKTAL